MLIGSTCNVSMQHLEAAHQASWCETTVPYYILGCEPPRHQWYQHDVDGWTFHNNLEALTLCSAQVECIYLRTRCWQCRVNSRFAGAPDPEHNIAEPVSRHVRPIAHGFMPVNFCSSGNQVRWPPSMRSSREACICSCLGTSFMR